ncbi:hypothetical protein J2TS4_34280 [Paenibacillus sp. J2TS4]|nr:hypothetical protein J2TS4_34280 [Paenibacillus sp. J2TS4]
MLPKMLVIAIPISMGSFKKSIIVRKGMIFTLLSSRSGFVNTLEIGIVLNKIILSAKQAYAAKSK